LFVYGAAGNYGIVYNRTTQTWGSPTLIRSGGTSFHQELLIATDKILMTSVVSTGFQAVVLSISGTTITVGTAATATLSITPTNLGNRYDDDTARSFIAIGSSYICSYTDATTVQAIAMTVSGTTVTVGSALVLSGALNPAHLYSVSASVFLALTGSAGSGALYATPVTVSGTTLTAGTSATLSGSAGVVYFSAVMGTRWAMLDLNAGTSIPRGVIVSVSGTTATMSSNDFGTTGRSSIAACMVGSKMLCAWNDSAGTSAYHVNVMSDNAGTATIGTVINRTDNNNIQGLQVVAISSTKARFIFYVSTSRLSLYDVDTSASSATMSLMQVSTLGSTTVNYALPSQLFSRAGTYQQLISNYNVFPATSVNPMGNLYAFNQMWGASGFTNVNSPNAGGTSAIYRISNDASYCGYMYSGGGTDVILGYVEIAQ